MKRAIGTIKRRAEALEHRTTTIGLLLLPVAIFLIYVSAASVNGVPFRDGYRFRVALPTETPPLKPADAVRVGGQRVGTVEEVSLTADGAVAELELDAEHAPVGRNAELFVRLRSASYLYYVDLRPGDLDDPLPEGALLPRKQVDFGTDPLEVARAFGEDTQEAFKSTVTAVGFGLAERGGDLNRALGDLEPALRQGTPQLESLTPPGGEAGDLVVGARRTARGLAGERPDDVEATLPAARTTLEAVAARGPELGRTIEVLPPLNEEVLAILPLADPLLDDAGTLVDDLTPALRELEATLPTVDRLLRSGGTLRAETGRLTAQLDPLLEHATPVLHDLYPAAAALAPALRPLRPVVAHLGRYGGDILMAGEELLAVTRNFYRQGEGGPALRFTPIFTCHRARNPYPEPGEARRDRQPCG